MKRHHHFTRRFTTRLRLCLCLSVAMICTTLATTASAQPVNDGFAGSLDQYIQNANYHLPPKVALVAEPGMQGKQALRLASNTKVQFIDMPVDENTKYMLQFNARFDGGESAEQNSHFEQFAANTWTTPAVSVRELTFLSEEKKTIMTLRLGMPFAKWTPYKDVFYPPAKARYLRITFQAAINDVTLFIDDLKLHPAPDEHAINPNPVLGAYGKHNFSGWYSLARGASMVTLPDGEVALDTKYGTSSMTFPLAEPGDYEISSISESNGYNYSLTLRFIDDNNKIIGSVRSWGNGKPHKFTLPANTVRGSFLIYSSILKEVRLVRAK